MPNKTQLVPIFQIRLVSLTKLWSLFSISKLLIDSSPYLPGKSVPYGMDTLLWSAKTHSLPFRLFIMIFLHNVTSLRMSQSMDGLALSDHSNTNSSSNCDISKGLFSWVLSKFKLSICSCVYIRIYLSCNIFKWALNCIQDLHSSPKFLWSCRNWSIEWT